MKKRTYTLAAATTLVLASVLVLAMASVAQVPELAFAAKKCETNPDDGSITCTGGGASDRSGTVGGSGGRTTCDASLNICTDQGGGGERISLAGEDEGIFIVGGHGGRATGDFGNPEDVDQVGGEAFHIQGPGGNSGR